MIKPLYFPNIYVTPEFVNSFGAFLKTISVYDVAGSDGGIETDSGGACSVEIITPGFNDDDNLMAYLMNGFNAAPFYEPELATQVGADLLKMTSGSLEGSQSNIEKDRILRARLFLQMAGKYDCQAREINAELASFQKRQQSILKELDGLDSGVMVAETDDYKTEIDFQIIPRLEAWSMVFMTAAAEAEALGEGLYVTDIADVIEHIIEFEPSVVHVRDLAVNDFEPLELSDYIKTLISCDWNNYNDTHVVQGSIQTGEGAKLSLYLVPGKGPVDFFCRFSKGLKGIQHDKNSINDMRNTVIAFVDM